MKKKYNIIIVDDHPIVIEGLKNLLSGLDFVSVQAAFTKGVSVFGYEDLKTTDIVFLDVFLKDSNGIDLCLKLKKINPRIVVLAISSQSERSIVMQMMRNGADGYLLKSASIEEFKACILTAINGGQAFCNEVKTVIQKISIDDLKNIPRLTLREKEVLTLLRDGKSSTEIAEILFLSFLTVQTHRRNLLNKYQVKNLVELLNFVKDNGLL